MMTLPNLFTKVDDPPKETECTSTCLNGCFLSEKLLRQMLSEAWDNNKSNSSEKLAPPLRNKRQLGSSTQRWNYLAGMEKRDSSRARRSILTLFVVLILAIFVILVTVVIAILYRVTLLQSERIQSLEVVIVKLTTRIHKLEASFAARKIDDKFLGETNAETEEKTEKEKRPGNKVCLNLTKYFVARCPNLCISNCVGEHKLFKRSNPRRCFLCSKWAPIFLKLEADDNFTVIKLKTAVGVEDTRIIMLRVSRSLFFTLCNECWKPYYIRLWINIAH